MVDEGLVALEVAVGHHGHVGLELVQQLRVVVLHVLLEGLHVVRLLVLLPAFFLLALVLSLILHQRTVLGEVGQQRCGRGNQGLVGIKLVVFYILSRVDHFCLDLPPFVDLISDDLRDLLQPVSAIGFPIVLWPRPPDRPWILAQIFLELLNFVLPLLIMIGSNSFPNQLGPFGVVPDGLQLLNSPPFLVLDFFGLVLDGVAQRIEVRYVFYEVLASVVLVVMVIFYFFALLGHLFALLQQQFVRLHEFGWCGDGLCIAEELADLGLREGSLVGFSGGHERADSQQFG